MCSGKMADMNEAINNRTEVVMYGSTWCPYTQRAMRWMREWNVVYRYTDVDEDRDSEALIASWNEGRAIRPTFAIGGTILINPDANVLAGELRARGLLNE